MLVPARQVGTHRTAGPVLQNEPPDGGVSGGVGRSPWWPSGCRPGFGSGSGGDSVHINSHGLPRFLLCSAPLWEATSAFWFGPNLKSLRLDARPCSAGRHASHPRERSIPRPRTTQCRSNDFRGLRSRSVLVPRSSDTSLCPEESLHSAGPLSRDSESTGLPTAEICACVPLFGNLDLT